MSDLVYRVCLPPAAFDQELVCLGAQLGEVLRTLYPNNRSGCWYYADVQTNGGGSFAAYPGVHWLGRFDDVVKTVSAVDQFERGVFFETGLPAPRFRDEPDTEDPPFADLFDAHLEIRAFDTSYFEVYSRDLEFLKPLAARYRVDVESGAPTG